MSEILSQAEVEAILSSIPTSRQRTPTSPPPEQDESEQSSWQQFSFHRPAPLRAAELEMIRKLQHSFGQISKARLEALLQAQTEINNIGVCQTTSNEYLESLKEHCVVCLLAHGGTAMKSLLVWSHSLLQSMFSRMLGGQDFVAGQSTSDSMTTIERRLLSKLNDPFLSELSGHLGLDLKVTNIMSSATPAPAVGAFPSIWLTFEIVHGGIRGLVHAGIPRAELMFRSAPFSNDSVTTKSETEMFPGAIPRGIETVTVEISACLGGLRMRTSDLASLQIGDILMTDRTPSDPVTLSLDGQNLCQAAVGTHSGRKALRLIQPPARHNSSNNSPTP